MYLNIGCCLFSDCGKFYSVWVSLCFVIFDCELLSLGSLSVGILKAWDEVVSPQFVIPSPDA